MKLDKLPDSITVGIDKYEHPVILFFLNHCLASGKATIENEHMTAGMGYTMPTGKRASSLNWSGK